MAAAGGAGATGGGAGCARTASQRPTYDYVSRTVYVTRSNSRMGVARKHGYAGAGAGLNLLDDMICNLFLFEFQQDSSMKLILSKSMDININYLLCL